MAQVFFRFASFAKRGALHGAVERKVTFGTEDGESGGVQGKEDGGKDERSNSSSSSVTTPTTTSRAATNDRWAQVPTPPLLQEMGFTEDRIRSTMRTLQTQ